MYYKIRKKKFKRYKYILIILADICNHFVYLGTNEGGPEYDKLKLHSDDNEENDSETVIEKLDDSYTGFYCYHPDSRSIVMYAVYLFPN